MTPDILRIKNGNVELINASGQVRKRYYTRGDAERVDWYDIAKGSIQVQLKSGKVLIINSSCQVSRIIY